MTRATTTRSTLTIGIDLGDRKSHSCVLDAAGEIVEESRIATTPKALRVQFEGRAPTRPPPSPWLRSSGYWRRLMMCQPKGLAAASNPATPTSPTSSLQPTSPKAPAIWPRG